LTLVINGAQIAWRCNTTVKQYVLLLVVVVFIMK